MQKIYLFDDDDNDDDDDYDDDNDDDDNEWTSYYCKNCHLITKSFFN